MLFRFRLLGIFFPNCCESRWRTMRYAALRKLNYYHGISIICCCDVRARCEYLNAYVFDEACNISRAVCQNWNGSRSSFSKSDDTQCIWSFTAIIHHTSHTHSIHFISLSYVVVGTFVCIIHSVENERDTNGTRQSSHRLIKVTTKRRYARLSHDCFRLLNVNLRTHFRMRHEPIIRWRIKWIGDGMRWASDAQPVTLRT